MFGMFGHVFMSCLGTRRVMGLNNYTDSCNDCLCKDVRHSRRLSTCLFRGTCYRRSAFTSSAGSLVRWCVKYSLLLPGGVELHSYNASEEDWLLAWKCYPTMTFDTAAATVYTSIYFAEACESEGEVIIVLHWAPRLEGEVKLQLHIFLTSAWDGSA
jgi:hypothetical protein